MNSINATNALSMNDDENLSIIIMNHFYQQRYMRIYLLGHDNFQKEKSPS